MKNTFPVLIIAIILLTFSCKKADTEVFIRIHNHSSYLYEEVLVNTSGGQFNYGEIKSDSFTDYYRFEFAYNYAYVHLQINSKDFYLVPNDYVGEKMLRAGYYTYVIRVENYENGSLSLQIQDD